VSERIEIETERFGVVEAEASELFELPGMPGFPRARRFVVRGHDRGTAFAWMVCADDPALAFVIANPWDLVPEYAPALSPRVLRALEVESADELQLLAIASFSREGATLNLAAPIAINPRTRRGMQVILESGEWPTRAAIETPAAEAVQAAVR
jgi:flagellar assembly factor FliW